MTVQPQQTEHPRFDLDKRLLAGEMAFLLQIGGTTAHGRDRGASQWLLDAMNPEPSIVPYLMWTDDHVAVVRAPQEGPAWIVWSGSGPGRPELTYRRNSIRVKWADGTSSRFKITWDQYESVQDYFARHGGHRYPTTPPVPKSLRPLNLRDQSIAGEPAVLVRVPHIVKFRVPGLDKHGRTEEERKNLPRRKKFGAVDLGGGGAGDLGAFVFVILLGILLWYLGVLLLLILTPLIYLLRRKLVIRGTDPSQCAIAAGRAATHRHERVGKPHVMWSQTHAVIVKDRGDMRPGVHLTMSGAERPTVRLAGWRQIRVEWADGSTARVRIPLRKVTSTKRRLATLGPA